MVCELFVCLFSLSHTHQKCNCRKELYWSQLLLGPGIKWLMNEGMNELPPAAFEFPNIYNRCPSVSFSNTNHTIIITGGNDLLCCWSCAPRKPQLSFPQCCVCLGCCLATALYVEFGDFSVCINFHFYIISNIRKK